MNQKYKMRLASHTNWIQHICLMESNMSSCFPYSLQPLDDKTPGLNLGLHVKRPVRRKSSELILWFCQFSLNVSRSNRTWWYLEKGILIHSPVLVFFNCLDLYRVTEYKVHRSQIAVIRQAVCYVLEVFTSQMTDTMIKSKE